MKVQEQCSIGPKYSNTSDKLIGCNDLLMNAFKKGRNAIVKDAHTVKFEQRDVLQVEFQRLIAATAIHYANDAKAETDQGDLLHVLSECYAFTRALRYAHPDHRKMSIAEVDQILMDTFAENLWTVKTSDLNALISTLSMKYNLEDV